MVDRKEAAAEGAVGSVASTAEFVAYCHCCACCCVCCCCWQYCWRNLGSFSKKGPKMFHHMIAQALFTKSEKKKKKNSTCIKTNGRIMVRCKLCKVLTALGNIEGFVQVTPALVDSLANEVHMVGVDFGRGRSFSRQNRSGRSRSGGRVGRRVGGS